MRGQIFTTVDAYMTGIQNPSFREALERLRKIIREELPDAQEVISYGMPGYKLKGYVCGFAAFKAHCSFFPGGIAEQFVNDLPGFKIAKGTIQFTPEKPIPEDIVREILQFRVAGQSARKGH